MIAIGKEATTMVEGDMAEKIARPIVGAGFRATALVVLAVIGLTGCAANSAPDIEPGPSATTATTEAVRTGLVKFEDMGVAYRCAGDGSPAVILEAGSDSQGTTSFPASFVDPIAEITTVCTYDRLGTGSVSSSPPDRARTLADLAQVLDGMLSALELAEPYVLVGQSAGAGVAIAYAAAHPGRVAALVPIEGYHDDPAEIAAWQANEGFTWKDNPEHVDPLPATIEMDAVPMPLGEFPVLVISASAADPGGPDNQAHWLGLSPNSRQIVIHGPHDLQVTAPEELAGAIVDVVSDLQRG